MDAQAYCEAMGKRLPLEEEWEYGARGEGRRIVPWGDAWDPNAATGSGAGIATALPVGSRPSGESFGGLEDMAGNVWEWTQTDATSAGDTDAILKGGSWLEANPANLRGAARLHEAADYSSSDAGFRCVKDL
jgi:formylglycine-generating enzyme required for sulfatase activity